MNQLQNYIKIGFLTKYVNFSKKYPKNIKAKIISKFECSKPIKKLFEFLQKQIKSVIC